MIIIGITGGICSGKSTVTKYLTEFGVYVLDADKLGHKAYEPNTPCFEKLLAHFGETIIDEKGEINRRVLGSLVFSDSEKMKDLQRIVWPEIRKLIISQIEELKAQEVKVVALEAAVMIEAGWYDLVTTLWVVGVSEKDARLRLMVRNSLSEIDAQSRIDAQISNEERYVHSNLIINNSADVEKSILYEKVKMAYESLVNQAVHESR